MICNEVMATRDGRRIRDPERTRAAILDAVLELFAQGRYFPTAQQLAEQAGVAPRTIFVHFADLEELAVAGAQRQAKRWKAHARPIPPDWPLERRVDALLKQRASMYETMTPVRRGGLIREPESPGLHKVMAEGDAWFRADTAAVFAPELTQAPDADANVAGGLLDALEAATSWASWDHLRSRRGLSKPAATRAIKRMILALLGP